MGSCRLYCRSGRSVLWGESLHVPRNGSWPRCARVLAIGRVVTSADLHPRDSTIFGIVAELGMLLNGPSRDCAALSDRPRPLDQESPQVHDTGPDPRSPLRDRSLGSLGIAHGSWSATSVQVRSPPQWIRPAIERSRFVNYFLQVIIIYNRDVIRMMHLLPNKSLFKTPIQNDL